MQSSEKRPLVEFSHISKIYEMGDSRVHAVSDVSFQIDKGEFVAIVGQSGSGKSTCMNIIGALDVPTLGSYYLNGEDISGFDDDELADIRGKLLGFVFQQYNLIAKLDVYENVELPLIYSALPEKQRRERVLESLERVGLTDRVHHMPNQLSGGQQQRVSIGRALINSPSLVLADEPTGNLDSKNSAEIIGLLKLYNKKYNQTLIVITHDEKIALQADRILSIEDGRIARDEVTRV